jgi:membrane-bound serine protease (ClpP class)
MTTRDGDVEVSTLTTFTEDGVEGITLKTTTIRQPGLVTRFFRLAATPEAAFFFLVVGLTLVTFEFYALGPGVAAGVAALSLWLAAWGVVNLPVRPVALAAAVVGWILLTTAYQRGGVIVLTLLGSALLQVGGIYYIDGSGQIDPRWWLVALSVLAALFFFLLAMPTVQRSRLSTQTIGRESLVTKTGSALSDFDPEGLVEVEGARWRATAHREAGISAGDRIIVAGVDGLFLEVEPAVHGERKT